MEILSMNVNGKNYKVVNNTWYNEDTSEEVIKILENARIYDSRVRIFYGDNKTGEDWLEDCDVIGRIGRSGGTIKIPLLLKKSNSTGGGGILTSCIVKITIDKKIVYQHENYHIDFNKLNSEWEKKNIDFFKGLTNKKCN